MIRNVAAWPRGRRAKWVVLAGWLLITMTLTGPLAGKLAGVQKNDAARWLPSQAEATQADALQERFQGTDVTAAVVVYERTTGITPADRAKAAADTRALAGVNGVTGQVVGPIASPDGQALQTGVPLEMGPDGWSKVSGRVAAISRIARSGDAGLVVRIAGPASFAADSARAFQGIDHTLLFATVAVVVIILLLAYRSPLLWLLPVMSAGVALTSAQAVIYLLARSGAVVVNGESAGILTVLVFGVGTDYALLLVARYKEELRKHADRHQAMAVAMRRAGPAIAASAATVAVSLLCLQFAQMNSTRGLGPVAAIGVGVALLVMITLLPALLVIFGRWMFWPVKPTFGTAGQAGTGLWARVGSGIARRPRLVWAAAALALAASALGVTQLHATGLTAENSFTTKPESVVAQQVLARHFPAG